MSNKSSLRCCSMVQCMKYSYNVCLGRMFPCSSLGPSLNSSYKRKRMEGSIQLAKSCWPVPCVESVFLPHFKLHHDLNSCNYKVVRLLSKGAFGVVYEVISCRTQDRWAMKVLQKSKILENDCVSQVKTEVDIQRAVGHHPFISSTPEFWQTKPLLFIVFELAERGDLHEFCSKFGPLPHDLCKLYVAQLAHAIEFLHEAGVIHRDVKPENILIDFEFNLKLADFGLAKWLPPGPTHRTYTICGSPHYTAPEVLKGEGYGHSADWWSLGQVACFLHTNKVQEDVREDMREELNHNTKDLLGRLLEPEPTMRLRSMRQLSTTSYFHLYTLDQVTALKEKTRVTVERLLPSVLEELSLSGPQPLSPTDLNKFEFF